ncbi:hypothetical protein ACIOC2_01770 [Streptomyces sp. NPDC088337]|uniref:hypothetical protein n=1 Tax=unclassified Streptomyces TaxID=2593676 RepID=UPI00380178F9
MTENDRRTSLGPLELTDGRWAVGDSSGRKGYWVELRADGLYQHEPDSEGLLIPWPRVMPGITFTLGAKYPAKGGIHSPMGMLGGLPGPWRGQGGGYLHMTLRHPYEDWLARFDRHPRFYGGTELVLFEELLRQTAQAGEVQLFGDPAWLGSVTGHLALQRPRSARAIREAVAEARRAARPESSDH